MGAGLSGMVEFIASLERPGGGQLAYPSQVQVLFPSFPAASTVAVTVVLAVDVYCALIYNMKYGNAIPNAFATSVETRGGTITSSILTQGALDAGSEMFIIDTIGTPLKITSSNRDVVAHDFEFILFYVAINTQEDLRFIANAIGDRGGQSTYLSAILEALHGAPPQVPPNKPAPIYAG